MPKVGSTPTFRVSLFKNGVLITSPTLAAGDVTLIKADNTVANITTLPSLSGAGSGALNVALSAAETAGVAGQNVTVLFNDQSGDEWEPVTVDLTLTDNDIDDLATAAALTVVDGIVDAILVDTDTTIPALIASVVQLTDLTNGMLNVDINSLTITPATGVAVNIESPDDYGAVIAGVAAGLRVYGTTYGIVVGKSGTTGVGVHVLGDTTGIDIDGTSARGVEIYGGSTGVSIDNGSFLPDDNYITFGGFGILSLIWGYTTRTLTSFGTLVADVATAVWASGTRTLTSFGTLVADIWSYVTRTLTSGGATAADVWSYVTRTLTAFGDPGGVEFTYTLTNTVTLDPLAEVDVWITTDLAGANVVWRGMTDTFGIARDVLNSKPTLPAGTYYFWRRKTNVAFVNPDTEVIS